MNKKTELLKNTVIIAIGKFSSQFISFLLIPFYTLLLNPSEYGYVDLVVTYITLLAPLIALQLDRALFRFLIDFRNNINEQKKVFSNSILIILFNILIITLICFGLIQFIKVDFAGLIIPSIISTIILNFLLQFSRGIGNNKTYAITSIIGSVITLIANIVFVFVLNLSVSGVFLSILLSNIIAIAFLFFRLNIYKYINIKYLDKTTSKKMLSYSLPLIPSGISWWIINVSDRSLVTIFINVAANGIYAVANKYATILSAVFSIFDMSWTESASIHIDAKDRDIFFSDVFNTVIKLFSSLGLVLITVLPFIFNFIISQKFLESYQYIPILIIATLLNAIVAQYSAIYVAKKMTKKVLSTSLSAAFINIILNIIFIKYIGLYATSLSTLIAFLTMAVFRHFDTKKYIRIKYEKYLFIKILLAFCVVIVIYYVKNPILNILSLLFVLIFTTILNIDNINLIKDKLSKKLNLKKVV